MKKRLKFRFTYDQQIDANICDRPDVCRSCLVQRHVKTACREFVLARLTLVRSPQLALFGGEL